MSTYRDLYDTISRLRAPGGCEWDQRQTPRTMRANLVEEAYEILDAIDRGDDGNLREELGDLFLVASTILRMRHEAGAFTPEEVFGEVCEKLVRRHPHVFGEASVEGVDEILAQWDRIKRTQEGKGSESILDTIPGSLPPLDHAWKAQHRAAKVGFDWPEVEGVFEKVVEEIGEIREAVDRDDPIDVESEVGDLLFSVVNLARRLGVHPGVALRGSNARFGRRFRSVESRARAANRELEEMSIDEMDRLWDQAKSEGESGK